MALGIRNAVKVVGELASGAGKGGPEGLASNLARGFFKTSGKTESQRTEFPCPKFIYGLRSLILCLFFLFLIVPSYTQSPLTLDQITSTYSDYGLVKSNQGDQIIFISQRRDDISQATYESIQKISRNDRQEKLWYSYRSVSGWSKPVALEVDLKYKYLGSPCFSPDGKYLYFSASGVKGTKGDVDIYVGTLVDNKVTQVKKLENINSEKWDSHPWLSPDGSKLYFSSNRDGGHGKEDIYVAEKVEETLFNQPSNLGSDINTSQRERTPFIFLDNKTLYFASDGFGGHGKLDLVRSTYIGDNRWTEVTNLGPEYNSAAHEDYPRLYLNERKIYYASDRTQSGFKNIIESNIIDDILPIAQITFFGKVFDAETKEPIIATVKFTASPNVVQDQSDPESKKYTISIKSGEHYDVYVEADGYLFASETIALDTSYAWDKIEKNFELQPIKEDAVVALHNILFDFDKATIREISFPILNDISGYIQNHPNLKLELGGHTDSIGSELYNSGLSLRRATSVKDYLVEKGVSGNQLTAVGYGESQPVTSNQTSEGRQLNRRTEFKVLESN